MYICLCLGVTTSTVQHAIDAGARSTKQVAEACGAGSVCSCRSVASPNGNKIATITAEYVAQAGQVLQQAFGARRASGGFPGGPFAKPH